MKNGKKAWAALLIAGMLSCGAAAQADGYAYWTESTGAVYFNQAANSEYRTNGYETPNSAYGDNRVVRVISKSASIWKDPRTNSKRLGTVANGEEVEIIRGENGAPIQEYGFYRVSYKGQTGWINQDYCVYAPIEIVLMESNVPAYCAPDSSSKKVGSLAKLTRYSVIGTYGDYYIINLRQAAAFVPMSASHYDSSFECRYLPVAYGNNGVVTRKTTLRTGPGTQYAEVEEVNSGYAFTCVGEINGWYVMAYHSKNTDGTVLVYVSAGDAQVTH